MQKQILKKPLVSFRHRELRNQDKHPQVDETVRGWELQKPSPFPRAGEENPSSLGQLPGPANRPQRWGAEGIWRAATARPPPSGRGAACSPVRGAGESRARPSPPSLSPSHRRLARQWGSFRTEVDGASPPAARSPQGRVGGGRRVAALSQLGRWPGSFPPCLPAWQEGTPAASPCPSGCGRAPRRQGMEAAPSPWGRNSAGMAAALRAGRQEVGRAGQRRRGYLPSSMSPQGRQVAAQKPRNERGEPSPPLERGSRRRAWRGRGVRRPPCVYTRGIWEAEKKHPNPKQIVKWHPWFKKPTSKLTLTSELFPPLRCTYWPGLFAASLCLPTQVAGCSVHQGGNDQLAAKGVHSHPSSRGLAGSCLEINHTLIKIYIISPPYY